MVSPSPSKGTYRTGRGPSPWVVSFPTVADKPDNFSATYQYQSFPVLEWSCQQRKFRGPELACLF